MEVPSAPSDPSCIPQRCQEPHLIEHSEHNNPAREVNVSEQPAELLGSRHVLAEGTRISMCGERNQNFVNILWDAGSPLYVPRCKWTEMNPNPMDSGYLLSCLK